MGVLVLVKWGCSLIGEEEEGYLVGVVEVGGGWRVEGREEVGKEIKGVVERYGEVKD